MKTLLILVPGLWLGGQERVAAKTADIMSGTYNVTLAVFDLSDKVYSTSSRIINLNIPSQPGKINKIINVVKRVHAVKLLRKELKADFVYSFGTTANLVNTLSKGTGRSLIGLRGFQTATSLRKIDRFILRYADAIICNSEEMCNAVVSGNSGYKEKTKCLYNPIDMASIVKQSKKDVTDYTFSPHTIVSHGRLDEVKNWPRLIKAFTIIRTIVNDAQLLIIGDGPQQNELESLIRKNDLQDSVVLLGFRSNPFAYLARSTIYVLPSYSEGFPNSLVEGMAFLPVVSVDCKSGPREILSDGDVDAVASGFEIADHGILVQPAADRKQHDGITNDDRILADAVLKVLLDSELAGKLKEAAKKRAAEFSCEKYHERLIEVFEKN